MISAPQSRAARALLNWSQRELADRAEVAPRTLALFEQGKRLPYDRTADRIQSALEAAGVVFLDEAAGQGVMLTRSVSTEQVG